MEIEMKIIWLCVLRHITGGGAVFSLFASDGVNVRFGTSSRTRIRLSQHLAPNPRKLLPPLHTSKLLSVMFPHPYLEPNALWKSLPNTEQRKIFPLFHMSHCIYLYSNFLPSDQKFNSNQSLEVKTISQFVNFVNLYL